MRFSRGLIAPVLAAVCWTAAVVPLLPSSGGGLMPCCEGGSPCGTALKATGCCRLDATSERAAGLAAAVTRSSGAFKAVLAPALWTPGAMAPVLPRALAVIAGDSPPHLIGIPLYLLNTALLR